MIFEEYYFTRHALEQMFARKIPKIDVKLVIENGEEIDHYIDDRPYPSFLYLKIIDGRPIHVVFAKDTDINKCIVITTYEPSSEIWENDYKTRKRK